jgi:hypothetical protein
MGKSKSRTAKKDQAIPEYFAPAFSFAWLCDLILASEYE